MLKAFIETEAVTDCAHLIQSNRDNIMNIYERARDNEMFDPVMIVLDLRDEKAARMARSRLKNGSRIRSLINECAEKKMIPTVILALPHEDAVSALGRVSQLAQQALSSTIPRSYFRVLTIAFERHFHTACQKPRRDDY
jgi:hypothetical protein